MSVGFIPRPATPGPAGAALSPPVGWGVSPRMRLAGVARDTALRVGGVLALTSGADGRFAVVSGENRIDGVLCVATRGGGYDVALRLVCALVPLVDVGERVRQKVREAAAAAGLPLETVSVLVVDVVPPREI